MEDWLLRCAANISAEIHKRFMFAIGAGSGGWRKRNTIARYPIFYRKNDISWLTRWREAVKSAACEGTYFLLIDYSAVSTLNDIEFCRWLTEVGVAAIPLSVFCAAPHSRISLCVYVS